MENLHITPEQITGAILDSLSGLDGATAEALNRFGQAFTNLMYDIAQGTKQEKKNEDPEQ